MGKFIADQHENDQETAPSVRLNSATLKLVLAFLVLRPILKPTLLI
jgi:hypothetical protein